MTSSQDSSKPTFREALGVWAKIGIVSFGGPAGQIALMHRVLVEEKGWIGQQRFLHALNFCMLLPGPEAMQLATYAGWRLHGTLGGLAAGLLFVLPGALIVLGLSIAYALFGQVPAVEAAFLGVKAAVLVIVIEALIRVARRTLHRPYDWAIAAAAFVTLFFFNIPFPAIIAAAALVGFLLVQNDSAVFDAGYVADGPSVTPLQTLQTAALWLAIWIVPLLAVSVLLGRAHVTTDISLFFSKLALVAFGGAYSLLAYMAQQAVEIYGWLTAGEMLDGLGLAETTPGPLILVTEFVGFLAGYRQGGEPALVFGLLGAGLALWATFVPSFLFIFTGAPYVERLTSNPKLAGALRGVTAAVVGVILNLSLWFALRVLFARVEDQWYGPLRLSFPDFGSLNVEAALLAILAAILLLGIRFGIVGTLAITAAAALAWSLLANGS
jgi:chromate transporter